MTEAMPFLQKTILLSYDPRSFIRGAVLFMETYMGAWRRACARVRALSARQSSSLLLLLSISPVLASISYS